MFTEAAQRLGGPDKLLADVTHCQELVQKILVSASNGTEAACGPTVSWLAELHLGVDAWVSLNMVFICSYYQTLSYPHRKVFNT